MGNISNVKAEKEIKWKEKGFYKEWTKWGRPKQD